MAKDLEKDPFQSIEHLKLDNGLEVFLAPGNETNLTSVRVEVDVGWIAENEKNWGVSHLLEHVLFRDKGLRDEMTYLQIIKEAGGSANGTTQRKMTSYFGTIPSAKGEWLLENFAKMLLVKNIEDTYVQKEKSTVELEIGTPGPITVMLGFYPTEILSPSYFKKENFWEREFGIETDARFTRTQEQLSNRKLTKQQVWDHYVKYYHPDNMRVYVAGKFNREKMLSLVHKTFGQLPQDKNGAKIPEDSRPVNKNRPYVDVAIADQVSSVAIGTKAVGMSQQEGEVLLSYTKYLAHTLMKEIRNKKGQTYTAWADNYVYGSYGYTAVSFQTPSANLNENVKILEDQIYLEAVQGLIEDKAVEEAKQLTLSEYSLMGREAEQLMENAQHYKANLKEFGIFVSPYKILNETTSDQYRAILKKYFIPSNKYEYTQRSPYLFPYDYILLYAAVAIVTFALLRKGITKEFKNDKIRWVRKIKYPPLKLLEASAWTIGFVTFLHLAYWFTGVTERSHLFDGNLFAEMYVGGGLWFVGLITIMLGVLCFLPRKLMVEEDKLIIKSVSYYSKKISLNEIESVGKTRCLIYPFPMNFWFKKVKFRFYFYSFKFWKEGLVINLKNGKSYFFSVEDAESARRELEGFLPKAEVEIYKEVA